MQYMHDRGPITIDPRGLSTHGHARVHAMHDRRLASSVPHTPVPHPADTAGYAAHGRYTSDPRLGYGIPAGYTRSR